MEDDETAQREYLAFTRDRLIKDAAAAGMSLTALPAGSYTIGFRVRVIEPFWCYDRRKVTFATVATHAAGYGDGEPDGWVKSWDGRYGAAGSPTTGS